MLTKILKGSHLRKSRLHDHKGRIVPFNRMLSNMPRAAVSGLLRVALDIRPPIPWISYDAAKVISNFLDPSKTVLEFGSGMSTLWYARQVGKVVSVESNRQWYDRMKDIISERGINNIEYRFAKNEDEYCLIPEGHDGFDFIMVDGSFRDSCTKNALAHLKPGGMYYLDNSDRMNFPDSSEARAGSMALEYARQYGCSVTCFTDFAPTQFFAQEGMMIVKPAG